MGGPWLADVYHLDVNERGWLLSFLASAQAVGLLLWGPMDRLMNSFRRPVMIGAAAAIVLLLIAAAVPLPRVAVTPWLIAFGLATAFLPVMVGHGRALFPDRLIGRGITLINTGTFAGAFFLQFAAGNLIGLFRVDGGDGRAISPPIAYQAMFAMLALILAAAFALYAGARDPLAEARRGPKVDI